MTLNLNLENNIWFCPLCKSKSYSLFEISHNRGVELHYQICHTCGLVFLSPRMTTDELAKYYNIHYRENDIIGDNPETWVIEKEKNRAEYQLQFFSKWNLTITNFLDIGASTGQLLSLIQEQYSCDVVGIEPGDIFRKVASKKFNIFPSIEELINSKNYMFDFISLSHVLEHLPDPVSFLVKIRKNLLHSHGKLYIEVPNLYGHSSFEPAHLYAFSKNTLSLICKKAGFSIKKIEIHNKPNNYGKKNISILIFPKEKNFFRFNFIIPQLEKEKRIAGISGSRNVMTHMFRKFYKRIRNNDK